MPVELKKSFHQKMLRRRITTMLRPSYSSMLADIKLLARALKNSSQTTEDCFDVCANNESICPELRAEQLLLLALHPQSPKVPLPPIPDRSQSSWAEPGWQLMIEDSNSDESKMFSSILPTSKLPTDLTQKFLSSCCSSGRQAASLIKPRHLRMLTVPLSFTCQASAPAEKNPSSQKKPSKDKVDTDPLSVTDKQMLLGYKFVVPTTKYPKGNSTTKLETAKGRKKRKAPKKADATLKVKAPAKRKKIQTSNKKASPVPSANDQGLHSLSQNQSILPPSFPNNSMHNRNQPMNINQKQPDQYSLIGQTNFPQQHQQQNNHHQQQQQNQQHEQKQQQFQHLMQMRQLQAQLQLQQQQQQSSNPSQMQMQFMPSQQQFNQQMNQMIQQQQQQADSKPASANHQLNKK